MEIIKTFNVYNEEKNSYVFNDRMSYDAFNEWRYSLLNSCVCSNITHPELIHVLFIDDEHKTMTQNYVYEKMTGTLLRLL